MKTKVIGAMSLALVASATVGAGCEPSEAENVVTVERSINTSAACFSTPPDITFRGGGKVVTPSTYNHSTCPWAYMIFMNQYSPSNTLGSWAAYAGSTPTTQTDCEGTHMTAYVWKADGTLLSTFDRRGAWAPDIRGVRHCKLPYAHLDYDIPGYKPGASYVIALQARDVTSTVQKLAFAAVAADTPAALLSNVAALSSALATASPGTVHQAVQTVFDKRGTPTGARLCRGTQLDKQISALSKQSVIRAGASPQAAADRDAGLSAAYTALCTTSGTAAGLQAGLKQYATAQLAIRDGMRLAVPSLSSPDQATVLADVTTQVLGTLVGRCGVRPQPVGSFIYDGTLPAGKTADNLLTGSCSGTLGQVGTNLGLGGNFPNDTLDQARTRFNKCLVDAVGQDRCNDPRADGAPAETNAPPPSTDVTKSCMNIDTNEPCSEFEKTKFTDAEKARSATNEQMNQKAAEDLIQAGENAALGKMAVETAATLGAGAGVAATLVGATVKVFGVTAATALIEAAAPLVAWEAAIGGAGLYLCSQFPEACGRYIRSSIQAPPIGAPFLWSCDANGDCLPQAGPSSPRRPPPPGTNRMCAPDFATGGAGWFETDSQPGSTRQFNQDDRIAHCACELLDGAYAGRNNGIAVSAGCPTPEEKFRQDCLTDPYTPRATPDPNAPVKPECLAALSPPTNVITRQTRICNAINCGSGQFRLTSDDGTCGGCVSIITDPAQGIPCRTGLYAMCTDGDPASGSCGCPPTDTVPLGNDQLCQYTPDDVTWPGLLSGFSVVNRKDLFATQFNATQQFAMLRPNRSMVGPTIYRNALTAIPAASTSNVPALRLNALISKKPPTGGNIDLQIYITSRGTPSGTQPLVHDFAGQVRLNNLATGTPTAVNIPLFAGANQQTMLNRAFNGKSLNIEYTVQGPSAYTRFVGIGSQAFVGASTTLPVTGRAPFCPRPSPVANTVPVLLPNPLAPNATPINPGTFTLSTGQAALLTDRIAVLRPLLP